MAGGLHEHDHNSFLTPIDRASPVPFYYQIKSRIRDNIHTGRWPVGYQIPTESELCKIFNVSRTVIRQALGELEAESLIVREKGRGTFVRKPKISAGLVQSLTGYYEDMRNRGLDLSTLVLSQSVVTASETVAEALGLPPDGKVIRIERLRSVMGEPIVLAATYIPYDLAPTLVHEDLSNRSLYQLLEDKFKLVLHRGRRIIEAVKASPQEAALLRIEVGAPLLYVRSITYLIDGRPVEYYEHKQRGDRSQLEVELIRTRGETALDDVLENRVDLPPANTVTSGKPGRADTP